MIFQERKTEAGWAYKVEDVFGVIDIESSEQLDGDTLDAMVVLLQGQNISAQTVEGTVQHAGGVVTYKFVKAPQWSDDDTAPLPELCIDTHTSIKKRVSGFIVKLLSMIPGFNWCKRFVVAFLEAWRSIKKSH
jgi:hypothetical protein